SVLTAFIMGFSIVIFEGSLVQAGLKGNGPDEKNLFVKLTNTIILTLPLFIRRRIAARMRAGSKAANSSKSLDIMDVNAQTVVAE
ncbi:hypothetical protein MJL81_30255, partial [Salmonella enterica subsp. enterica serovar Anatum]|nr:hypothetical protein [Salmonella enterica subsp. enterica serovar Anatum]